MAKPIKFTQDELLGIQYCVRKEIWEMERFRCISGNEHWFIEKLAKLKSVYDKIMEVI